MKIFKTSLYLFVIVITAIAYQILIVNFAESQVRDRRNRIYSVTVNTHTPVIGGGYLPGRVYYHVENQSTQYDVKRSETEVMSSTDTKKILRAPDGWWEDKYNVYQSSWYYQIITGGPANVAEYQATIAIHERD